MATAYTNIDELLRNEPVAASFTPYCHLNEETDTLAFKISPAPDYSDRLTEHVTIFQAIDTKEITGCRIKGVSGLLEDLPNFIHVDLRDGLRISVLFLPFLGAADRNTREILNRLATASKDLKLPCGQQV